MPTGIEEVVAAFEIGVAAYQASSAVADAPANISSLQESFLDFARNRAVLDNDLTEDPVDPPVYSPIFDALVDLYNGPRPHGRSYVLYASSSTGKSAAAKLFLKGFLLQANHVPTHGLMIGGIAEDDNYVSHMAARLGATGTKGWANALVGALKPNPSTDRLPSILILDEFNFEGPDGVNLAFARRLYKAVVDQGFYVLFITQNETLATRLCNLNNRVKIAPLPKAWQNPGAPQTEPLSWASMLWGRKLMTKFMETKYAKQFPEHFAESERDDDGALSWLTEDMNPHEAYWALQSRTNRPLDQVEDALNGFLRI